MDDSTPDAERAAYARLAELTARLALDAEALDEIVGLGEPAVPALRDTLSLDDTRAQRFAAMALARLPARRAMAALLNKVETTSDDDLAALCLRATVSSIEPRDADRLVDWIDGPARHDDPFVRAAAVDIAARLEDARAVPLVLRLISDSHPFVAERAAAALESLANALDDETQRAAQWRQLGLLASRNPKKRAKGVAILRDAPDTVERISAALEHDNARVRMAALEAATEPRRPELFERLEAIARLPETSNEVRVLAICALEPPDAIDDGHLVGLVTSLSTSPDTFVRGAAAAFAVRCDRVGLAHLAGGALRDRNVEVRRAVAESWREVASHGGERLVDAAIGSIEQPLGSMQTEAPVTTALIVGLERLASRGVILPPRATAVIRRLATASSPSVAAAATRAAGYLNAAPSPSPSAATDNAWGAYGGAANPSPPSHGGPPAAPDRSTDPPPKKSPRGPFPSTNKWGEPW